MQTWSWFLSADIEGRWIVITGHAEVVFCRPTFAAKLLLSSDPSLEPYHLLDGMMEDGILEVTVSGRDIAQFSLSGPLFEDSDAENSSRTVLLTDGSTVIGLTFGPRSHERDL